MKDATATARRPSLSLMLMPAADTALEAARRRLAFLAERDGEHGYRTVCRLSVPPGTTCAELAERGSRAIRRVAAAAGEPEAAIAVGSGPERSHRLDSPAAILLADDQVIVELPARWADEATILGVAAEMLGDVTGAQNSFRRTNSIWPTSAGDWETPLPSAFGPPERPDRIVTAVNDATTGWLTAAGPAEAVADLARATGTEAAHVLLAAWQLVVRQAVDGAPVVVGVHTDLRRTSVLTGLMGPLSPYLPMRAAHGWDMPFAAHIRVTAAEAAGRGYSGERLPCFGFAHLVVPPGVEEVNARTERFALRLAAQSRDDGLRLRLEYDAHTVSAKVAARLLTGLGAVLVYARQSPLASAAGLGRRLSEL